MTMINPNHLAFLLISTLLLVSLQSTSADENLIHSVCGETPSPDTCESILLSDPRGILAYTRKDLAIVAVEATITVAITANRNAGYMAGQYAGSPQAEALSQCEQLYMMLAIDLQSVRTMLRALSFEEAYQAAIDVWRIPDACDNEFAIRRLSSLLAQKNKELDQKVELCVNLTYQMIGQGHY
jgi:pectinesterase inhibitor-like protein